MTKKNSTRTIALLTALVLVTACFIGGTIARYVTSTSSEDEARVAVWGINADGLTEMDLFNATYTTEDGTIVAQSNDGDKIIAPGTHKDNKFSIVNTDANLNPEVMYEIRISLDDSEIDQRILDNPSIQWRLDGGAYGTWEETKAKILTLSGHESGVKTYAPGDAEHEFKSGKTHTIGWQWLMDNGTDELDTEIGNAAVNDDIKATIKVSVTAKQVDVDTTGLLDGNGQTFDLNNPTPLTFRSSAPVEELQSVKVGDTTLTRNEDYTAESGSTIITLNENYLSELEKGNYTLSIISTNMTVKASFKIEEGPDPLIHNGIIPEGGTYYRGVSDAYPGDFSTAYEVLNAGENFPNDITYGDVYVYGEYEYHYNAEWGYEASYSFSQNNTINGWNVYHNNINHKTTPSEILKEINGKKITALWGTFAHSIIITSPKIPDSVTIMNGTFYNATDLETAPTIPSNVTSLWNTFMSCPLLSGEVKINAINLNNFTGMFDFTTKPIWLTGSCPKLEEIANGYGNVYSEEKTFTLYWTKGSASTSGSTVFTYREGMTWGDFINSDYNTNSEFNYEKENEWVYGVVRTSQNFNVLPVESFENETCGSNVYITDLITEDKYSDSFYFNFN